MQRPRILSKIYKMFMSLLSKLYLSKFNQVYPYKIWNKNLNLKSLFKLSLIASTVKKDNLNLKMTKLIPL